MSNIIFALESINNNEKKQNYIFTYGEVIRSHPTLIKHQVLSFCGALGKGALLDTKKMFDNLKKLFITKINHVYSQDSLLFELNESVVMTSSGGFDANDLLSDVEIKINHLAQIIKEYSKWEGDFSKSKGTKRLSAATIFEVHRQNKKQKKDVSAQTSSAKKPRKKSSKSKVTHTETKSLDSLSFLSSDEMPSLENRKAFSSISELGIIEEFKSKFYDVSSFEGIFLKSPDDITVLDVHDESI